MRVSFVSIPPIKPQIALPADERMPEFLRLFDIEWVWQAYRAEFGEPEESPRCIRAIQLNYKPGVRACVSYSVEWKSGQWVQEDRFAIELTTAGPDRLSRYPDDPRLTGLAAAASPVDADLLLAKHTSLSLRRPLVEVMRYRPGTRAVLRYTFQQGQHPIFVRVMPPARVKRWLASARHASKSGFDLPRTVGSWQEGGLVWSIGLPGETLRRRIQMGAPPNPDSILDALAGLWSLQVGPEENYPLDVLGGFRMTERLLCQVLRGNDKQQMLPRLTEVLKPFAEAWRPSAIAHNDFHDDQLILTPEGRLGLVDFDEVGPGDPLLDVANLLAHLRWMAHFGNAPEERKAFHRRVQDAALVRFGWDPQSLNLREGFVLFRLSAGPIRQLRSDWASRVESGLALAYDVASGRCG